jgi:hypothetical protein
VKRKIETIFFDAFINICVEKVEKKQMLSIIESEDKKLTTYKEEFYYG